MFAFALDTIEEPQIITKIDDVKNLESKNSIGFRRIRLINVENISKLTLEIEKAISNYDNQGFIHILDHNNSIITGTFISDIKIVKSEKNNLTLSGNVWHHPQGYQKAWKMKMHNEINQKNMWKTFEKDELQGWLVFALNNMHPKISKENIEIEIDGNDFHNLDEFFCTLGEEVNGIAGYFGRSIPALYDCMRGDFGVETIKELTWINHQKSKKLFRAKFNEILETFKDFDVKITLI